jgi:dUTP pyrophosphatase
MYILKVKKLSETAIPPSYAHPGDAGLDIFSNQELTLKPGEFGTVKTGIAIQLPPSTEAQVRPRSGLASKNGISVLNTPGTIDEGYRGEIGVILINHSKSDFKILPGMKIAQMVIAPVVKAEIEQVDSISETQRGEGGFGSTGL